MSQRLVLASTNKGKLREITEILRPLDIQVVSVGEYGHFGDIEENGRTYQENARLKAEIICAKVHEWVLSDDSGLEVDALHGAPGLHSARYAGPEQNDQRNIAKLLDALKKVPDQKRQGRFRCVAALARPGLPTLFAEGVMEGVIAREARGSNGFGYDPVFFLPELGRMVAELSADEKNQLSHRSRAFRKMAEIIASLFASL